MQRLLIALTLAFAPSCADSGPGGGGCCKVCKTGRPCGDSCIASNKACNRSGGCACSEADFEIDMLRAASSGTD